VIDAAGVADLFAAIVASAIRRRASRHPSRIAWRSSACRMHQYCRSILALRRDRGLALGARIRPGAGLRCVAVTNSYPADELTAPSWSSAGCRR
jgi:hypothetical protein